MNRCKACPFRDGENEEATMAQNLGCLPSAKDMVDAFDDEGVAISCHEKEDVACIGLKRHRDVLGVPVKPNSDWYYGK